VSDDYTSIIIPYVKTKCAEYRNNKIMNAERYFRGVALKVSLVYPVLQIAYLLVHACVHVRTFLHESRVIELTYNGVQESEGV